MRDSEIAAKLIVALVIGLFVFMVLAAIYAIDAYKCHTRWEDSGYQSRYGLASGCQILVEARWIPEKVYRAVGGEE